MTNQFVHYMNLAASGMITSHTVIELMSLQVPMLLGYMLPLGLFLGILLTLGRFYVNHEMVVLFSCGVSRAKVLGMVMIVASFVAAVTAWLLLSVYPKVCDLRTHIIDKDIKSTTLHKVLPARFQNLEGGKRVIYAKKVAHHTGVLTDVFLAIEKHNEKGPDTWDIISANKAYERKHADGSTFLVFDKGVRYLGIPGEGNYQVTQFGQYWGRLTPPIIGATGYYYATPTMELWKKPASDLVAQGELQWRFAMPLSVLIFALLAVPLSRVNPRKGKFTQIFPAILIYVLYANFMFMGRSWIRSGDISPTIGLWWIHGSLLLLALILHLNQIGWRQVFRLGRHKS